jgi:hypothetical protein
MIDIEVTCNECWGKLEYEVKYNQYGVEIIVMPCECEKEDE